MKAPHRFAMRSFIAYNEKLLNAQSGIRTESLSTAVLEGASVKNNLS